MQNTLSKLVELLQQKMNDLGKRGHGFVQQSVRKVCNV